MNSNTTADPSPRIASRTLPISHVGTSRRLHLGVHPKTGPGGMQHPNAFSIHVNAVLWAGGAR